MEEPEMTLGITHVYHKSPKDVVSVPLKVLKARGHINADGEFVLKGQVPGDEGAARAEVGAENPGASSQ